MYQLFDLYAPYLALAGLLTAVVALGLSLVMWRRLREVRSSYVALTAGTGGGSLESVLNDHLDNVRAAVERSDAAWETAIRVEREVRHHIQHVVVIRYNPFSHTGGDQSFVLTMADGEGNGAIVNSLHARDGTRVYAKPLAAWESTYVLTDEERDAIARAQASA